VNGTPTVEELLREARARLQTAGVDGAALDARVLVGEALRLDMAGLVAAGRQAVGGEEAAAAMGFVERRAAGEPVARILGRREFFGREFRLSAETLVPRPETEEVVEAALAELRGRREAVVVDVGTGTGAILVTLLAEHSGLRGIATDISADALSTARRNAAAHGVADRAAFVLGSYLDALGGPFDLVVANPPYIASGEIAGLQHEVRGFDPRPALDGGEDGLDAYRAILARAPTALARGGALVLEIGHDQGPAVAGLASDAGFSAEVRRDLGGRDRIVVARHETGVIAGLY
jgi:release factor glutamine methyltransferase